MLATSHRLSPFETCAADQTANRSVYQTTAFLEQSDVQAHLPGGVFSCQSLTVLKKLLPTTF